MLAKRLGWASVHLVRGEVDIRIRISSKRWQRGNTINTWASCRFGYSLTSVQWSDTDAVRSTEAPCIRVKLVGRGSGARWPCSFLVAFARENDSSHFSSLLRCNACVFKCLQISGCRLSNRNWELCFSRLHAKEARSRRQFQIYEIFSLSNNISFYDILEKICLK